jgi:hypothetical protein
MSTWGEGREDFPAREMGTKGRVDQGARRERAAILRIDDLARSMNASPLTQLRGAWHWRSQHTRCLVTIPLRTASAKNGTQWKEMRSSLQNLACSTNTPGRVRTCNLRFRRRSLAINRIALFSGNLAFSASIPSLHIIADFPLFCKHFGIVPDVPGNQLGSIIPTKNPSVISQGV